jgi:hypothetical protein
LRERVGLPLRLVLAILRSSDRLIDLYIPRDAPLSDDLERWPRLAAKAAPAAICCFLDFAGILMIRARQADRFCCDYGELQGDRSGCPVPNPAGEALALQCFVIAVHTASLLLRREKCFPLCRTANMLPESPYG